MLNGSATRSLRLADAGMLVCAALLVIVAPVHAQDDSLYIRIIDVGLAHSAVVRYPGDHYKVYDAWHRSSQGAVPFNGI